MPELPEVETVARLVRPDLLGRTITGTRIGWERTLGGTSRQSFGRGVRGARIESVERRGKYIRMDLVRSGDPAGTLLVHLRMTGRLHVEEAGADPGPYARVSLNLDDGRSLHFIDVRKFGRFVLARGPAAVGDVLGELGPEPLGPDFTAAGFAAALGNRRRILKPLLLDQSFVAGLGNIYVDESLHRAGIHPLMRSERVSTARAKRLHGEIQSTLREAIEREGSSFDTFYRTPEGQPGSYQHQFQVYGRTGKPCHTCGAKVQRIVVGQRGTHFCPRCQRKPAVRG